VRHLAAAGLALGLVGAGHGEELGRKVFTEIAQPPCMACHTLKAAGATGNVGPSLDELQPDLEQALAAVRQGVGIMPSFDGKLTAEQIEAVARYVAKVAGK
jgi:mono/diheme cytochrome c family protein